MSQFGGGTVFGTALFGGDPVPLLYLLVDAETTTEARRLMARGITDGTSLRATEFAVGRDGFDPYDYRAALPVNPDADDLDDKQFTDVIDYIEHPNERCTCYYCLLEATEANTTLGEIAIYAEVQNSPGDPADGSIITLAIGHFPLIAKNDSMQYVLRVTMQA